MAAANLDTLSLITSPYAIEGRPIFEKPKLRAEVQPYLQSHGGSLVEDSDLYDVVTHTIPVQVSGTSIDNLHVNISTLQQKVLLRNYTFEWQYPGATEISYADVLFSECDDPYQDDGWEIYEQNLKAKVNVYITCKPGWRGEQQTVSGLSYTKTPAVIQPGSISGDMETPAITQIIGDSTGWEVGNNLYLSARSKNLISEASYNPIKDFSGSSTGNTYNGQYKRTSGVVNTWTNITGTDTDINSVSAVSASVAFRCGDGGLIDKTSDSGVTWTAQTLGTSTTQNFNDIQMVTADIGFAVGNAGKIYKTTNGSASPSTWNALTSGTSADLKCLSMVSTTVGYVGVYNAAGNVLKTTDGSAWSTQTPAPGDGWLNDIHAFDANSVYSVSSDGVSKTTNGGTDWTACTLPTGSLPIGCWFTSATTGWVIGANYKIHKTTDSGSTWVAQTSGVTNYLDKIAMFSASVGWIVGDSGTILYTSNGGTTWTQQTSGVSTNLNNLSIIDANNVYAAGGGNTILTTTNAGTTWTQPIAAWPLSMDYKGQYIGLVRARTNSTRPNNVWLRGSVGWGGGSVVSNTSVAFPSTSTRWQWVDNLGTLTIPVVNLSSGVSATPVIKIEAKNGSTKSIQVDVDVAAIPSIDGEILYVSTAATNPKPITADFENEAVNKGYDNVTWTGTPGIKLRPGTNNNILLMETQAQTTSLGSTGIRPFSATIKYYPRYLSPIR